MHTQRHRPSDTLMRARTGERTHPHVHAHLLPCTFAQTSTRTGARTRKHSDAQLHPPPHPAHHSHVRTHAHTDSQAKAHAFAHVRAQADAAEAKFVWAVQAQESFPGIWWFNCLAVMEIEVPGESSIRIEERVHRCPLNQSLGRLVLTYNIEFTPDMTDQRIRNIIAKAAEVARERANHTAMTETSTIVFLARFPECPDDESLFECKAAQRLAGQIMAQGWAGLLLIPWTHWHVRSVWHLLNDVTIDQGLRPHYAQISTVPFFLASNKRIVVEYFSGVSPTPAADEAVDAFRRLYPQHASAAP